MRNWKRWKQMRQIEKMFRNKIGIFVLIIGIVFVVLGVVRQEDKTVEKKSNLICLECVGIG